MFFTIVTICSNIHGEGQLGYLASPNVDAVKGVYQSRNLNFGTLLSLPSYPLIVEKLSLHR